MKQESLSQWNHSSHRYQLSSQVADIELVNHVLSALDVAGAVCAQVSMYGCHAGPDACDYTLPISVSA